MNDPARRISPFADVLAAFEPAAFMSDGDGRVRAVNRRFCELVGQEPDAVVGREQPYPWWPDDQRPWFVAQLGRQLESAAGRTKFEGDLLAADGRRVPVSGTVSRMLGGEAGTTELLWVHRDRLQIERLLDAAPSPDGTARPAVDLELALRRLFESNIIGIITGENDRILTANEAFLSMLGYTRTELEVGSIDWPAITPPEWLEIDAIAGEQMLRTGSAGPVEKEYLRRDGSRARVRMAGAVVEFEPFRWVSFVEDITEAAQKTERLRVAHEQLNTLFGMAAHDLRSPIMVVEGYASMLLEGLRGRMQPGEERMLDQISRSGKQLAALADDLLSLSEMDRRHLVLDLRQVDVSGIMEVAVDLLHPLADRKDIGIELDIEGELTATVDPRKMEQVVMNLLTNAIKFSPPGTTVRVRARALDSWLVIEVIDQGPGIPADEQPGLFTPFARASVRPTENEPSTGLGLAIAKRIVEAHGGHIELESEPGHGSIFRAQVPTTQQTP